jgi:beta-ketoacyl synthase-like protein
VLSVSLRRWAAWAPGLADAAAWQAWAQEPRPVGCEGSPDARFLPPMLRRRCTALSKAMLHVAFEGCPAEERSEVRTVFASRHGENKESFPLFESIAKGQPLSPAKFTHTVHNAQAGLFSIASGNRQASSSLSGERDTFASAFLEALTHLEREPARSVLVVTGDVPIAPLFAPLLDEREAAYAVALLLAKDGEGTKLGFELISGAKERGPGGPGPDLAWPQALEFVRWLHDECTPRLELGVGPRTFRWHRA